MNCYPKVLCLMGPTASGKTALALELAREVPCEIISVDSAMIYKSMNIGTAKPTVEELASVPHHLIGIIEPTETYSVAQFRKDALKLIAEIVKRDRLPVLVGGTMMYFKALIDGLSPLPEADEKVREDILTEVDKKGWSAMHKALELVDPESAERIHPHDPQRLIRALEVHRITGKSLTELTAASPEREPYEWLQFALIPKERKTLHTQIEQRFLQMLEEGFVEEVHSLMQNKDLHPDLPSMRCVGYRQCWHYLQGEYDYDEMVAKSQAATRQLAKRQLTWLRSWKGIYYLEAGSKSNLEMILKEI